VHGADVRFGSLADVCPAKGHVRFTPPRATTRADMVMDASATSLYRVARRSKASATFAFVTEYAPGHAVDIEPVSGRILRNSGIIETVAGDFRPLAASKTQICNSETAIEFKKRGRGGRLRGNGLSI